MLRAAVRALSLLPLLAQAACSRPIAVPVAPLGMSVIVKGEQVSGVFPELLDSLAARTGCRFVYSVVPRARLEMMFGQGRADLLVAATRSPERDKAGVFIPLVKSRAVLITLSDRHAPIHDMAGLLASGLKLALVRGFDYGEAYRQLIHQLDAQQRLVWARDPFEVARMLDAHIAQATILPASSVYGAVHDDPRLQKLVPRMHIEALDELPWHEGGVYLSTVSLPAADRALLNEAFEGAARSGALWRAYRRWFPPAVLELSTRPL